MFWTSVFEMRGVDHQQGGMFSYLSPEERVRADHPLRAIRRVVDEVLGELSPLFGAMYSLTGRPSIPPEKLLRALLIQMLYSIRSERLLMEEIDYNVLFRWFVGMNLDEPVWDATTFTKNRERLLDASSPVRPLRRPSHCPAPDCKNRFEIPNVSGRRRIAPLPPAAVRAGSFSPRSSSCHTAAVRKCLRNNGRPTHALLKRLAAWHVGRPDETRRRWPSIACRTRIASVARRPVPPTLHTNRPDLPGPSDNSAARRSHLPSTPSPAFADAHSAALCIRRLRSPAAPFAAVSRCGEPCAAACAAPSGRTPESRQ